MGNYYQYIHVQMNWIITCNEIVIVVSPWENY